VGYGDMAPATPLGQLIASAIMILGYGIIAVPTGIVSAEMVKSGKDEVITEVESCPYWLYDSHTTDAEFCSRCGYKLDED